MSDTTVCAPHALGLLIVALTAARAYVPDALKRENAHGAKGDPRPMTTDPHGLDTVDPHALQLPYPAPWTHLGESVAGSTPTVPEAGRALEDAMRVVQRFDEWPEGRPALLDGVLTSRNAELGAALLAEPGAAAELARTPEFWERADEAFTAAVLETAAQWFGTLWKRRKASKPVIICDDALTAVKGALNTHSPSQRPELNDDRKTDLLISIRSRTIAPSDRTLRAAGRIALLAALDPARADADKGDACALRILLTHPCANEWWDLENEAAWFAAGPVIPAPLCMPGNNAKPPTETGVRCMVIGQAARAATRVTGQEAPEYRVHWQSLAAKQMRLALQPVIEIVTSISTVDDVSIRGTFLAAHTLAGASDAELVETLERVLETAHRRRLKLSHETVAEIASFDQTLPDNKASRTRIAELTAACAQPDALLALGPLVGALTADERLSVLVRVTCSNNGTRAWRESVVDLLLALCRDGDTEALDRKDMALLRTGVVAVLQGLGLTNEPITENPDGQSKETVATCIMLCETLLREYETTAHTERDELRSTLEWLLLQFSVMNAPHSGSSARWVLDHNTPWGPGNDKRAVARAWAAACLATSTADCPEDPFASVVLEDIVQSQGGECCVDAIRQYGDGNSFDVVATCAAAAYAAGVPWENIAVALDEKPGVGSHSTAIRIAAGNCATTNTRKR